MFTFFHVVSIHSYMYTHITCTSFLCYVHNHVFTFFRTRTVPIHNQIHSRDSLTFSLTHTVFTLFHITSIYFYLHVYTYVHNHLLFFFRPCTAPIHNPIHMGHLFLFSLTQIQRLLSLPHEHSLLLTYTHIVRNYLRYVHSHVFPSSVFAQHPFSIRYT